MKGFLVLILALIAFQSVKAEALAPQSTGCDACQYVVGLVENYIDANYTVDEITNFLDQWCGYVPQFAQMCDQIVQYGVQDFIAYVENDEDPATFCKQVGLCNTVVVEEPENSNCDLCEYVITVVENYVSSNTTINEFIGLLDNYCSLIPGLAQVCDQIVQYGVDEILQLIQQDASPSEICTKIGLCTSQVVAAPTQVLDNCAECEFVVSLIESYVNNNSSVQSIIAEVDKACNIIPGIEQLCDQLVAQVIQQIVAYINQDYTPSEICTLLKLCSSAATTPAPAVVPETPVPEVVGGGVNCDACQYVVTIIESYVEDNYTIDEIQQELENACTIIPGIQQACDQFIQYGLSLIVQYVNQNLPPLTICTKIGLCTSPKPAVMAPLDTNCDLCKYVVGIVEEWLESNDTISQIVTRLDAMCTYVPGFEAVCDQIIQMGVQEFVSYIETNEQPETVCTQIQLCTSRSCGGAKKAVPMMERVKKL